MVPAHPAFAVRRAACENAPSTNPWDSILRERRRSNRFNLQGRVRLTLAGREFEFPAADISVTGLGVMLDIGLLGHKPSGEVGFCRIESTDLPSPVEAFVSVMRMRRIGDQHLIGLRFESISDEQLDKILVFQETLRRRDTA